MKLQITPFGRRGVLVVYEVHEQLGDYLTVLTPIKWQPIEKWCQEAGISYRRMDYATISFYRESDVTAFLLRWS